MFQAERDASGQSVADCETRKDAYQSNLSKAVGRHQHPFEERKWGIIGTDHAITELHEPTDGNADEIEQDGPFQDFAGTEP